MSDHLIARIHGRNPDISAIAAAVVGCGHIPPCDGRTHFDYHKLIAAPAPLADPEMADSITVVDDPKQAADLNLGERAEVYSTFPVRIYSADGAVSSPMLPRGFGPITHIDPEVADELVAACGAYCAQAWRTIHFGTGELLPAAELMEHARNHLVLRIDGEAAIGFFRLLAAERDLDICALVWDDSDDPVADLIGIGPRYRDPTNISADADDFFDDHPGTPGTGYITPTTTIRKSR